MQPETGTSAITPPKKKGIFYGWWVVASCFLANFGYAEQFNTSYGVFVAALSSDMGWARTALAGVASGGRLTEAVFSFFLGPVVDRHGTRWLIGLGGLVVAAAFVASALIGQVWQLYALKSVVMAAGAVCLGGFIGVTVCNWFVVRRGRAVGILHMGSFLATGVMPLTAAAMIEAWGWRGAWLVMGLMVLVLTLPAVILVRRRPEDMGLHPDGIAPGEAAARPVSQREQRQREALLAADVVWTRAEVLRTPIFWICVFAWGLSVSAIAGTNLHLVPFFQELGYPLTIAAAALALRAASGLIGSPIWGLLLERAPLNVAASLPFACTGVALLLFVLVPTTTGFVIGLFVYGIGVSGNFVAQETIWANYFGRTSLGLVRSIANPPLIVFSATGPLALGLVYDLTGSYQLAWLGLAFGFGISAILVQFSKPPRHPKLKTRPAP